MYSSYLVLCGMIWARFGDQDAGLELIRALASPHEDVRVVARAMLEQAAGGSRELIGLALVHDEITPELATLCAFENAQGSKLKDLCSTGWFRPASA